MTPLIVSHTRTGTHYLARLLYDNLECGVDDDYEKLHFSHSRIPQDGSLYIHLYRPLLPVMISMYGVREHLGMAESVTLEDMTFKRWDQLPRSTSGGFALFNGTVDSKVCTTKVLDGETLPMRWVRQTVTFGARAYFSLSYDLAVTQPVLVCDAVMDAFQLARRLKRFSVPFHKVGWWNGAADRSIQASESVLRELQQHQSRVDNVRRGQRPCLS